MRYLLYPHCDVQCRSPLPPFKLKNGYSSIYLSPEQMQKAVCTCWLLREPCLKAPASGITTMVSR